MRNNIIIKLLLASMALCVAVSASADHRSKAYRDARSLYGQGLYERAKALFDTQADDPLSQAYSVLCSVKIGDAGADALVARFDSLYPRSVLSPQIHYEYALRLFDAGEYAACNEYFSKVTSVKKMSAADRAEFLYKKGYCDMELGHFDSARDNFYEAAQIKGTAYTAPARFELAYACYVDEDFTEAFRWFSSFDNDPRFADVSHSYMIECKFMLKDYKYVVTEGENLYQTIPAERQVRLARIMSESYLVLGNAAKAKQYLQNEDLGSSARTDADYFHAASVMYAVKDYAGAIRYFVQMSNRSDSLGQIANYQLANAYIITKNKVAAMQPFADAASVYFDPAITEDALFNYAKLSFDLNRDNTVFERYMNNYPQSNKMDLIYGYQAVSALQDRDYALAVENFDRIENLSSEQKNNYVKANYLRAQQLVSAGSYSAAVPFLKAAAYYRPKTDRLWQLSRYWLAECYFQTEKYNDAIAIYTELMNLSALQRTSEGEMIPYNAAYCYYKQNKFSKASPLFDRYINSGAKSCRKDALLRRADCDYAQKQYEAATKSYGKAVAEFSDPNDIYPYYHLGLSYGLIGNKVRKITALEPVLKASPDAKYYSDALYELARGYIDNGKSQQAIDAFNRLRSTTKDETYATRALLGLGMVNRNEGAYETAARYYKDVIEKMPGSEYARDALLALQSIYQSMGKPEAYLAYVESKGLTANQTPAEKEQLYFNTAEQLFLAANYSQATTYLGNYLSRYPNGSKKPEVYFYLAECAKQIGSKEKALEHYKTSIASGYCNYTEPAMVNAGNLAFNLERYEDAYDLYQSLVKSARIESNVLVGYVGMMKAAYWGRMYENAITAADKVEKQAQTSASVREARYIKAKSLMASSRRDEAMAIFKVLSREASTAEGAESCFILIQNKYDSGLFDQVQSSVYDFASRCGNQSYWLAKAYLVLGDTFLEQGNYKQARATYNSIRDGYSGSDEIADDTARRIERLNLVSNE